LLPSHKVSGVALIPAMMAGAAGNNLLPAHFGEFVRVYFAGNKFSIPKSTVLATVMAERIFDVIAVLLIFSIAIVQGDFSGTIVRAAQFLLLVATVAIVMIVSMTFFADACLGFISRCLGFLGERYKTFILDELKKLTQGLSALKSPRLMASVAINSLMQWLLMVGCIYFSLIAFSIDPALHPAMLVLGILVAGLTLPTSPGFFGTMEYCFVLGLATVGVDASTALSAAIYYHVPAWVFVTLIGLALLRANRLSMSTMRSDSD